ncbi:MAG: N-acetylmuramoyl-L-alanine amidase [Armatimonadetes bacterium]|nr:N-acetylmuramoyl-L-alanine amidase [Armatimonadota bacterium]
MNIEVLDEWLPHNSRPANTVVDVLCLHHTADRGTPENDVERVIADWRRRQSPYRVSAHYILGRSGRTVKCVPYRKRAWHAGRSTGPHGTSVNDRSVGVELCNNGIGEPYPEVQVHAFFELMCELRNNAPRLRYFTGHHNVGTPRDRKVDPWGIDMLDFAERLDMRFFNLPDGRPASRGI